MRTTGIIGIICGLSLTVMLHTKCSSISAEVDKATPPPAVAAPTTTPSQPENTGVTKMDINQNARKSLELLQSMDLPQLYTKYLDLSTKEVIDFDTLVNRLKGIQVIYVGEFHTNVTHHDLQLNILKQLNKTNPKVAVAMEFFYRSQQTVIDDYVSGKMTDKEFAAKGRGGFGGWYNYYEGIIGYAVASKLKVIGLNVEKQIKAKMADQGWDKLTPEEQKLIAKDIDTTNEAHREFVLAQFRSMMNAMGPIKNNSMLDRFYLMQCIWDETFGETIANYVKAANDKETQVVVVLGNGHVENKFNTPNRSYKRYPAPFRTIVPVQTNKEKRVDFSNLLFSTVGDFVYFSDVAKEE